MSIVNTARQDAPAASPRPEPAEPWSAHALRHLQARREGLAEHNPRALQLAADVLGAIHGVLGAIHGASAGPVPAIRADRAVRRRAEQLAGERALPVEDLAAIALEHRVGHAAVLAGLHVLAAALGYELRPLDPAAVELEESAAAAAHGTVTVLAGLAAARADGITTPVEAAELVPDVRGAMERLSEVLAGLEEIVATESVALDRRRAAGPGQPDRRRGEPASRWGRHDAGETPAPVKTASTGGAR